MKEGGESEGSLRFEERRGCVEEELASEDMMVRLWSRCLCLMREGEKERL